MSEERMEYKPGDVVAVYGHGLDGAAAVVERVAKEGTEVGVRALKSHVLLYMPEGDVTPREYWAGASLTVGQFCRNAAEGMRWRAALPRDLATGRGEWVYEGASLTDVLTEAGVEVSIRLGLRGRVDPERLTLDGIVNEHAHVATLKAQRERRGKEAGDGAA